MQGTGTAKDGWPLAESSSCSLPWPQVAYLAAVASSFATGCCTDPLLKILSSLSLVLDRIPLAAPPPAALAARTAAVGDVSEYTGAASAAAEASFCFVGVTKFAESAAALLALFGVAAAGAAAGLAAAALLLPVLDKRTSPLRLSEAGPEAADESMLDLRMTSNYRTNLSV